MYVTHAHVCGMLAFVALTRAHVCVQDRTRTHVKIKRKMEMIHFKCIILLPSYVASMYSHLYYTRR